MKGKNVLVLTYWSYADALIQTYTLPYVRILKKNLPPAAVVYLFTLEKEDLPMTEEVRLEVEGKLQKEGILWRSIRYSPFGLKALFKWFYTLMYLTFMIIRKGVDSIHCWATPAGAAGYLLSLVTGRQLVLDSYEPHAEAMTENGTWKKTSFAFRLLFWLEKKQSRRAKYVISATHGMKEYAREKYEVDLHNFYVKHACVDLDLFSEKMLRDQALLSSLELHNKTICVYAGKFGGIYLEKEVFDLIKVAADYWGESFRFLLLSNHKRQFIDDLCRRSGVDPSIVILKFVPHHEVPGYMGLADFAITPVKPVPTKRFCTPIKDGEYWALGLPIIIPNNISDDSEIIRERQIGAVLDELNEKNYRLAVQTIDGILKNPRAETFKRIRDVAVQYRNFAIAEGIYKAIYAN